MATDAIIIGVGAEQGLGAAIARRFAREGHRVIVAGRTMAKLATVVEGIEAAGGAAEAIVADATDSMQIGKLFDRARDPEIAVFNAGVNIRTPFRDISVETFEEAWRTNTLGGFVVGREAARRMVPLGRGTLIFTGASASLRGAANFAAFASAKAGLRAIAQSAARELGPLGLHVAHAVIDGGIDGERLRARRPERVAAAGEDGLLSIEAIAEAYWQIHRQHRSAWTLELDLRPYKEPF
ncbi:SDR family NAD(P)-dependent oxidoreductase [Roseococcus sp.]|uniref:SDR family NAD(P)-dependent oxidoreductase n=1 Tax=Roseococcus sp. TaxID=2109646 RepID=UPI003BAAB2AB